MVFCAFFTINLTFSCYTNLWEFFAVCNNFPFNFYHTFMFLVWIFTVVILLPLYFSAII